MPDQNQSVVTRLLEDIRQGNPRATEELLPLVYQELRRLAKSRMAKEPAGQTLQPTALVHEAYLRLVGNQPPDWSGRGHFFAACAEAMRRILVERARRKASVKHGGQRRRIELDDASPAAPAPDDDILAIDEALKRLEADDPRKGQIVNMRYFAGLTVRETADALEVSVTTIEREWRYIKRWLFTQLSDRNGASERSGTDEH